MRKIVMFISVLVMVLFFTACDKTVLVGEIVIVEVGMTDSNLLLVLEVPEELSEVHDVMWTVNCMVEDENVIKNELIATGEILLKYYSVDELKQFCETDELRIDRIALFMPSESGNYIIEADGFYKQTNPQPITKIEVEIK